MSASGDCQLVCVDPKEVHKVWPHVARMIRAAVLRTNLSHTHDVEYDIMNGDALLWLAWNGQKIEAAASTIIRETDSEKLCVLTACGGENMHRWVPLLELIENWARGEGCKRVRIYGREGWLRILQNYKKTHVIVERSL